MSLGMDVGLGPGQIVLDGDLAPELPLPRKGHSTPLFSAHVCCGQTSPISATAEHLLQLINDRKWHYEVRKDSRYEYDYVKSIGTGSKLAAYFLRWVPKQQQQQM